MRFLILGPPCAGKKTQAEMLAADLRVPCVSVGRLLRQAAASPVGIGRLIAPFCEVGRLVPDELAIRLVEGQLQSASCQAGFVLAGYPRTLPQAKALEWMLEQGRMTLSAVAVLDVPEEQLVYRLVGRRVCERDGRVYHLVGRPPVREGRCNECGGSLVSRRSDDVEYMAQRLLEYTEHAHAVREFYAARGLLRTVDGAGEAEGVYRDVLAALAQRHQH